MEGIIAWGGNMEERKPRKFHEGFKAGQGAFIRGEGKTVAEIARDPDLPSAVRNWLNQAAIDEGRGGQGELTTAERQELQRLRREKEEEETQSIEKAAAFFAKESR